MANQIKDALDFPEEDQANINNYLPQSSIKETKQRPFVTLTFATSLDSQLALAPGTRTTLSGPRSKAMTHYLRSKHDAILIGVGTAIADNPSLNCRLFGAGGYGGAVPLEKQPRPIILDPAGRWACEDREVSTLRLAAEEKGRAPFVLCLGKVPERRREALETCGGKYVTLVDAEEKRSMGWEAILAALQDEGIRSVMVEGGGCVINSLLAKENSHFVDSVIVTIAPTWLGQGGVVISPERQDGASVPVARLNGVSWQPLGEDVVLCGRLG